MSAPDTNTDTLETRHKPVLTLLRILMLLVGLGLFALVAFVFFQSDGIEGADAQVQPGVGVVSGD